MLADWYFCTCIGASPATTHALLSILAVLDDEDRDARLIALSYDELARTDARTQLYVLPRMLSSLSKHGALHQRSLMEEYFESLARSARDDDQETVRAILGGVSQQTVAGDLSALNRAATRVLDLGDRPLTRVPYLDLLDFAAESVIVAVVAAELREPTRSRAALVDELGREGAPLGVLLRQALENHYGRLPCRLAARVICRVPLGKSPERVLGDLCRAGIAPLEPDLLDAIVDALGCAQPELSPDEQAMRFFDEARHGRTLATVMKNAPVSPEAEEMLRMRVGIVAGKPAMDLPTIYWRALLRYHAAVLAPDATVQWLGELWHARGGEPPDRNAKFRPPLERPTTPDEFLTLSNPWLAPAERFPYYWHTAQRGEVVVNVLSAALVAVKLLTLATVSESRDRLLLFVGHASDVLHDTYRDWLMLQAKVGGRPDPDRRLSLRLTGLALFARDALDRVGCGRVEAVDPGAFVDILARRAENRLRMPRAEQLFTKRILPRVLVRWVEDAYSSAVHGSPSHRWLAHVGHVYSFYLLAGTDGDFARRLRAAALVRFVAREQTPSVDAALAWQSARYGGQPLQWRVHQRQLLLTDRLPPVAWRPKEWAEPDPTSTVFFVRALERLVVFSRLSPEERAADTSLAPWRTEWLPLLRRIRDERELDRFVRLRLLEIFDGPLLDTSEQEEIATVILEFGSAYDMAELFRRAFPIDEHGKPVSVGAARAAVQHLVVRGAVRAIERQERGVVVRKTQGARSPYRALHERTQIDVLSDGVTRLALWQLEGAQAGRVAGTLRSLLSTALARRAGNVMLSAKADIASNGRLLSGRGAVAPWFHQSIVVDRNQLVATVFADRLASATGDFNGFKATEDEWRELSDGARTQVKTLAFVIQVAAFDDGTREYAFNWGDQTCLRLRRARIEDLPEGVVLPVRIQLRLDAQRKWVLDERVPIEWVPRSFSVGDVEQVSIADFSDERFEKRVWDADLSRRFAGAADTPATLATIRQDGRRDPVDHDLVWLLLNGFKFGRVAVLTVIDELEEVEEIAGLGGWRFSTAPGENFLLRRKDFTPESASQINDEIEDCGTAYGLLVAVSPTMLDGLVRLALANRVDDTKLESRYPSLRVPFDRRNIEWTRLFRPGVPEKAQRIKGQWFIEDPDRVPGFPDTISVRFKYSPKGVDETQLTVLQWNPEIATVTGDPLSTSVVSPAGGDWKAFLARWLDPQPGQRVTINNVIDDPDRYEGLVFCSTSENVGVLVEGESLTMEPIYHLSLDEPRQAEIVECQLERHGASQELRIDVDAELSRTLEGTSCSGILTRKPLRPYEEALCEIVWQVSMPRPLKVTIRDLNRPERRWISQGTIIDAVQDGSGWRFFPRRLRVIARAWWSVEEDLLPGKSATYLDMARYRDHVRPLMQVRQGKLAFLTEPVTGARHLGRFRGRAVEGGLAPGERATSFVHPDLVRRRDGKRDHRLVLRVRAGMLPSRSRERVVYGSVEVAGVQVRVEEREDGMVVLRRDVALRYQRSAPPVARVVQVGPTPEEVWTLYLANDDRELDVVVERRAGEFFVRLPEIQIDETTGSAQLKAPGHPDPMKWTSRVRVAPDYGPALPHIEYDANGRAMLIQLAEGEWVASFRVRPWTTTTLCTALGARIDQPEPLGARKLVFVGAADPADPDSAYEFEYGYGCLVRVPQRKLRFDKDDFRAKAEVLLYGGDRITAVTFFDDDADAVDGEGQPILSINGVEMLSDARTLYEQRHRLQIVHMLKIESVRGLLRVISIEGFEDRRFDDEPRSFRAVTATLTPESRRRLEARFEGRPEGTTISVLGRLDEGAFLRTRGRTLQFHHVRLSFEPSTDGEPLQTGERIFLQCGEIETQRNETMVVVRQPEPLMSEDVGRELSGSGGRILRRNFSVREELLRRIHDDPQLGPDRLVGRLVLARVRERTARSQREDEPIRRFIHVSLCDQPPRRRLHALASALQKGPTLVAIAEHDESGTVVEVRPTVFVRFPRETISAMSDPIERGAIMRVEKAPGGGDEFILSLAAFSDRRYARHVRPAVALPKNDIFSVRDSDDPGQSQFWTQRFFSVGDLPGLLPMPGHFDRNAQSWTTPRPSDLIDLMLMRHPKLVTVGTDASGERLAPSIVEPCGRLDPNAKGLGVVFSPLRGSGAASRQSLLWRALTFGDETITQVRARVDAGQWRYHDQVTVTWLPGERSKEYQTGTHTGWTGPLFFQRDGDGLTLRYSLTDLLRYGGSVDLLLDALRARGNEAATLPVAAVTENGKGLWIEIAPGRVAELPGPIVSEAATGAVLTHFNWRAFSPGDRVTLRLARGEAYAIDTIALVDWRPGPRHSFEGRRALLPIAAFDRKRGGLSVGSGEWSLTLPIENVGADDRVAVVTGGAVQLLPEQQLVPEFLRQGDVVLLSRDIEGRPSLAGWPALEPKPYVREGLDWLTAGLVTMSDGRAVFGGAQFIAILDGMGGSLPVGIDEIDPDGKTVYVSRRGLQDASRVLPGTMSCGRVVAFLSDRNDVLLRVGGGLLPLAMDLLVAGLPPSAFDAAIEALRRSRTVVWIRADSAGRIRTGISEQTLREFRVFAVSAVVQDTVVDPGVIVRSVGSLALYWLPLSRASWMEVPRARAHALLVERQLPSVAMVDNAARPGAVSIIDTADAKRQFGRLAIGEELTVSVVEELPAREGTPVRYVVEAFPTSVMLELEERSSTVLRKGDEITVEVDQRNVGQSSSLLVVRAGQRQLSLDLPNWMMTAEALEAPTRIQQQQYREWWTEPLRALPASAKGLSDEDLAHALCIAYLQRERTGTAVMAQAKIAEAWTTRTLRQDEVSLPFALMALLVLDRSAEGSRRGGAGGNADRWLEFQARCRKLAFQIARELGRRALRSAHTEVLSTRWLGNPDRRNRRDGLWERLNDLAKILPGPQTEDTLKVIRQFCEAVDLREADEHRAIADALLASLGELDRLNYLRPASEICRTLIALARMVPPNPLTALELLESQRIGFQQLLNKITVGKLDIVLLRGFRV